MWQAQSDESRIVLLVVGWDGWPCIWQDLRKAVDTQELSPEDVASIDQQRQHARERLAAVEKQRDEMRRELHEEEASLDREVEAVR